MTDKIARSSGRSCGHAHGLKDRRSAQDRRSKAEAERGQRARGRADASDQTRRAIELGVVDLEGILQVGDPELFLGALRKGFGRAKAYGFGLMLIRRAT